MIRTTSMLNPPVSWVQIANYPWLFSKRTKVEQLVPKINAMRRLGVLSTTRREIKLGLIPAKAIVQRLAKKGAVIEPDKQIVALIAYLQKLGTYEDLKATQVVAE